MSNPETKTPEIKRKMHFKGKVLKTTLAGAIVDIGMNKPGVVHIAHMSDKPVKRVEDALQIGAEVDVWVRRVKKDANPFSMQEIFAGQYCGACHGTVAFPNIDCQRCHTKVVM